MVVAVLTERVKLIAYKLSAFNNETLKAKGTMLSPCFELVFIFNDSNNVYAKSYISTKPCKNIKSLSDCHKINTFFFFFKNHDYVQTLNRIKVGFLFVSPKFRLHGNMSLILVFLPMKIL